MGRKKKSKQDARGYSQGPGVARPGQTAASTATSTNQDKHDDITTNNKSSISSQTTTQSSSNVKNLLTTLLPQSSANTTAATSTTLAPHKFHTRLTTITSTLLSLSFTPSQIQSVVLALQYDITLESALDWLCLHLDTDELPSVFVDHNGGIKLLCLERNGGERSLLSVVSSGNKRDYGGSESEEGGGKSHNRMLNVVTMNEGREREVEKKRQVMEEEEERVKEEQKRRLLLQYEYEQDDNDADDDDRQQQQQDSDTNTTQQQHDISTKAQPQEQSPLQIQLGQEELKLQILEADLANDANNYMRSKFEMKELQKEVKKMRRVVNGLRRKVEREDITINLLENTEVYCSDSRN